MNAAGYFTAAIPEPFRILGLELKPLSLGRYKSLKRFDCGFVADESRTVSPADLILGVLICSMRVDEFLEWIGSGSIGKEVSRWSKTISPNPWIGKIPRIGEWWRERHSFNLLEKISLFKRYIKSGSECPDYFDESSESTISGAHWAHTLEVVLRSELNWTDEEINEEPLTKGLFHYFKWAESQGSISFVTEDDRKQAELNANVAKN